MGKPARLSKHNDLLKMGIVNRFVFILVAGVIGISSFCPVYAITPFVLNDHQSKYTVGAFLEFLEDPEKTLTIEQIVSPQVQIRFFPSPNQNPNFGFTESVYWAHLQISNQAINNELWLFELKGALLRHIDFYYQVQGQEGYHIVKTGIMRPVESRELEYRRFVFKLPIQSGQTADIYLRVDNDWALFPLTIWSSEAFAVKKSNENLVYGLIYGTILTVVIIALITWILLRDISFFYLAGWLISISLLKSSIEGLGVVYLWRNQFAVINVLYSSSFILTFFFALRFEMSILKTKTQTPKLNKVLLSFQAVWLALLVILVSGYIYLIEIIHMIGLICILLMLSSAVFIRYRGFKPATYYLLGWIVLFMVAVQGLITLWQEGADYEDVEFTLNTGVLLPMFFFSLALINQIITFTRQHEQTQQLALNQAKEHELKIRMKNIQLKQVNEEAMQAKENAEIANQAKSNFLISISHELRTPLHQIITSSELLKFELQENPNKEQSELVDHSQNAANHLLKMIDDILDISDIEQSIKETHLTDVSLKPLLEGIVIHHAYLNIKSNIKVAVNVPEALEEKVIQTDERILKQVLFNLFSNAVKFSHEGGRIEIKAIQNGQSLQISISDEGIGIEASDQEKVFDPFFQVQSGTVGKTPGVGLGLTLSKKLIGLLNGEISLESEGLEKGSCFTIKLPDC